MVVHLTNKELELKFESPLSLWYSPSLSPTLLPSFLHQRSCKHQCRQLLAALPFDLPSVSCVRG